MQPDRDPSVFNYSPALAGSGTSTLVPEVQKQQTTVNLAAAASIDFDFNVDTDPIFDMFVFADQILDVLIFLRQGASDTFRQLDAAIYASGVANVLKQLLTGVRFAGSQVRVRLINNSGVATTVLSAQVHARSM
jgi:hypothetical protein